MKLKSSAIAVAVAGALGASMAVQAESGFYGSVRIGLINTDTGGNSELQVQGVASRFGFRGETDLGNGLTAFGRYEFGVSTEGAGANNPLSRRHAYVGLKGDWGSVIMGQTYHTYYNFISGPLDNPWRGSGFGTTWLGYTGRTAQAITYSGQFGGFGLGATAYMDNSGTSTSNKPEDLDGYELAGNIQAGPILVALGVSQSGNDRSTGAPELEPIIGVTASGWQTGMFTWGLSYEQQKAPTGMTGTPSNIIFDVAIGNGYFHTEMRDNDFTGAGAKPVLYTLGYTQSLGRQTTAYYEVFQLDADTASSNDDITSLSAVLKYDWK
jgi:predicted porin